MSGEKTTPRAAQRSSGPSRAAVTGGVALLVVLAVVLAFRLAARPELPDATGADPSNTALVSAGERLYSTRCATCHGAGTAAALDSASTAAARSDQQLFAIIKNGGASVEPGLSAMPAFGQSLSDTEIWAIISYLRSVWS